MPELQRSSNSPAEIPYIYSVLVRLYLWRLLKFHHLILEDLASIFSSLGVQTWNCVTTSALARSFVHLLLAGVYEILGSNVFRCPRVYVKVLGMASAMLALGLFPGGS